MRRSYLISPGIQLAVIVPLLALSIGFAVALCFSYFHVFARVLNPTEITSQSVTMDVVARILAVSFLLIVINVFTVSAVLVVQTHQILGPLVAVKRHLRKLADGHYGGNLKIRKDDKLHDLVETINELTERLRHAERTKK